MSNENDWFLETCKRIGELIEKEDRKDVEFRMLIASSEIGDVLKYITHDPKLNPNARPYGTLEDEMMAYGQLFVQYMATAHLRGISLKDSIEVALKNWEQADWRKVKAEKMNENYLKGRVGCEGHVIGKAFVDPNLENLNEFNGKILVTRYAVPDMVNYFKKAVGVVTDEGGVTSHAAIIAREYNLPCIVGTGDATDRIRHGQEIEIIADYREEYGKVILKS